MGTVETSTARSASTTSRMESASGRTPLTTSCTVTGRLAGVGCSVELVGVHDVTDVVDEQRDDLAAAADDDVHRQLVGRTRWQPEAAPQVERGDDLTAQVDQTQDGVRGARNDGELLVAQHLLHVLDAQAEVQAVDPERAVLTGQDIRQGGRRCGGAHRAPTRAPASTGRTTASRSTRSVTRSCTTAEPSTPGRRPTSVGDHGLLDDVEDPVDHDADPVPAVLVDDDRDLVLGATATRAGRSPEPAAPAAGCRRGTARPPHFRSARSGRGRTPRAATRRSAAAPPGGPRRPPAPAGHDCRRCRCEPQARCAVPRPAPGRGRCRRRRGSATPVRRP